MDRPQVVTRAQAVSRRVISDGKISKVLDYFGGAAPSDTAQAYLVEVRNYVTRPHFHPVDQFQILYGSPGSLLGRRPIGDLVVHYADAHTVYGPLIGADPPLRYFTLRAEPTTVTAYMPESRALLPGPGGRNLHSDLDPLPAAPGPGHVTSSRLLGDERDGLEVSYLAAGPGARITIPGAGPAGQFFFLVAGAIESEAVRCPPESMGWQPPGSPTWEVTAGQDGAGVLVLRYPLRSGARAAGTPSDAGAARS